MKITAINNNPQCQQNFEARKFNQRKFKPFMKKRAIMKSMDDGDKYCGKSRKVKQPKPSETFPNAYKTPDDFGPVNIDDMLDEIYPSTATSRP